MCFDLCIAAAAFLGLVGGISALFGFSRAVGKAKKSESKLIEKGGTKTLLLLDEGSTLAMRAFGWGSLYAVLGTGAFFYGVWKLSGAKNVSASDIFYRIILTFRCCFRWRSFVSKWVKDCQKSLVMSRQLAAQILMV